MLPTHNRSARLFLVTLSFFAVFAVLISIEIAILLIFNPTHVLGDGDITARVFVLLVLPTHRFFTIIVLLVNIVVALLLAMIAAKPLALQAYLHEVRKAQKRSYREYFPLEAFPIITPESDPQNPTSRVTGGQQEKIRLLDLLQQQQTHLLLTGGPGAGKTTVLNVYQYAAAKRRWSILRGRDQLPVYIPMDIYSLFFESMRQSPSDSTAAPIRETTLFQFLLVGEKLLGERLPGMHHLRPYLKDLMKKGRLLFLCDGLNEVNGTVLPDICKELSRLMHQTPANGNRIIMTCREVDYNDQPQLRRLVIENRVAYATINQLEDRSGNSQIEQFVEAYVDKLGKTLRYAKEQFMEVINRSGLRRHCTNPMMLSTLIKIIDDIGIDQSSQLNTRGLLLEQYIRYLIRRKQPKSGRSNGVSADSVVRLLSEVACAVRWASDRTARAASNPRAVQLNISVHRNNRAYLRNLADKLGEWLDTNRAQEPFTLDKQSDVLFDLLPAHEQLSDSLPELIEFTQRAGLIDISASGKLRFGHELIAEYFVAEYFREVDSRVRSPLPLREELLADVRRWKEPVTLWAGLIDDPMKLAERFAALGKSNSTYTSEAATLSLTCIGVLWTSRYEIVLPQDVLEVLAYAVRDEDAQRELARQLNDCAQTGGREVYQSLLPLLTFARGTKGFIKGVEGILVQLNKQVVPELFNYLEDIINIKQREGEVQSLIRVLGQFRSDAVGRAIELSQPGSGGPTRLRTAAISILGRTNDPHAVTPLVAYLGEQDPTQEQSFYKTTKKALTRLGPRLALSQLIQALENPTPSTLQIHHAVLDILESFLNEAKVESQNTLDHYDRILEAIISTFSSSYASEIQQQALKILVGYVLAAPEQDRSKKTIESLVKKLSYRDQSIVSNVVKALKEIGKPATQMLLFTLAHSNNNATRICIIEVIEHVHDPLALDSLLQLVADPVLEVRQRVADALCTFALSASETIPGLIRQVMRNPDERIAKQSAIILGNIGEKSLRQVVEALSPLVQGRSRLLVEQLQRIPDPQGLAIPELIDLLGDPKSEHELALAIIRALGHYHDKRVVSPLLGMLKSPVHEFYADAIQELSGLGELAFDELIADLDVEQESTMINRVQNVLHMSSSPEQLIESLEYTNNTQAQRIMDVLLMKGEEAARVLTRTQNFDHSNLRVRNYVRQTLERLSGRESVPPMVDKLLRDPKSRADSIPFLLSRPQEAIPELVRRMHTNEYRDVIRDTLLQFGPQVILYMLPGLDSSSDITRDVIVRLASQQPEEVLDNVVLLLKPSPSLSAHAYAILLDVLTIDLAHVSLPHLLRGLENASLKEGIAESCKRLVQRGNQEVINGLLAALRKEKQYDCAKYALVKIGAETEVSDQVVARIVNLITDQTNSIAYAAQDILREVGGPALPFIWTKYNDTSDQIRRDVALKIFHEMSTDKIKGKLVELLTNNKAENITMGLGLLLERVMGESARPNTGRQIIPALLEHLQKHNDDVTALRIIAWLLVLGGKTIVGYLAKTLQDDPNHQERLARTFLLLGKDAEDALLLLLSQPTTPSNVQLKTEVAGMLGMLAARADLIDSISVRAMAISQYGYGASTNQAQIVDRAELSISLSALGGLLAGRRWQIADIEDRRRRSQTQRQQEQFELLSVLLGERFTPVINQLKQEKQKLQQDLTNEKEARQENQRKHQDEIQKLNKSFRAEKEQLLEMNNGLEKSNQELKKAQIELQARNDELQVQIRQLQLMFQPRYPQNP